MRKYMINVAKFKKDEGGKYFHFFRIEMGGYDKNDVAEVVHELHSRFPSPDFKVEVFEGPEQYYTQISL